MIWAILGLSAMLILSTVFGVQLGATSTIQGQAVQAAQTEMAGTIQLYIKELWNLPIGTILISFIFVFMNFFSTAFPKEPVPPVINKVLFSNIKFNFHLLY